MRADAGASSDSRDAPSTTQPIGSSKDADVPEPVSHETNETQSAEGSSSADITSLAISTGSADGSNSAPAESRVDGAVATGADATSSGVTGDASVGPPDLEASPFVCGDSLPDVVFPTVYEGTGEPPEATGGYLVDGVYVPDNVVVWGTYSSVPADVFALKGGYVHNKRTTFSPSGSPLTGYERVGSYATTGSAMVMDVVACGLGDGPALWEFTATPSQITLFRTEADTTWVQTFVRQD